MACQITYPTKLGGEPELTDENSLASTIDRLKKAQRGHYAAAEFFYRRHFSVGLITVISATVASSLTFFQNSSQLVALDYLGPALGIIAAIFAAIQTFARYLESYEAHRVAAVRYGGLVRLAASLGVETISKELAEEWNRVAEASPVTPAKFRNLA